MIYSICLFEWNNHFEARRSPATDKAELHLARRLYSVCLGAFKSFLSMPFCFSLEGMSDDNGCVAYSFVCFLIDGLFATINIPWWKSSPGRKRMRGKLASPWDLFKISLVSPRQQWDGTVKQTRLSSASIVSSVSIFNPNRSLNLTNENSRSKL